jgi:hypothetical protein
MLEVEEIRGKVRHESHFESHVHFQAFYFHKIIPVSRKEQEIQRFKTQKL